MTRDGRAWRVWNHVSDVEPGRGPGSTSVPWFDPGGGAWRSVGPQPASVSTTSATLSATITSAMTPATTRVVIALTSAPITLRREV